MGAGSTKYQLPSTVAILKGISNKSRLTKHPKKCAFHPSTLSQVMPSPCNACICTPSHRALSCGRSLAPAVKEGRSISIPLHFLRRYAILCAYESPGNSWLRLPQLLQRWWYTRALYCYLGYICIVIAIILLPHSFLGQASFKHLKRPMILVSYSSIDPLSVSAAKKVKEISCSSNRGRTLSCNAGYVDHDSYKPFGFNFALVRD